MNGIEKPLLFVIVFALAAAVGLPAVTAADNDKDKVLVLCFFRDNGQRASQQPLHQHLPAGSERSTADDSVDKRKNSASSGRR